MSQSYNTVISNRIFVTELAIWHSRGPVFSVHTLDLPLAPSVCGAGVVRRHASHYTESCAYAYSVELNLIGKDVSLFECFVLCRALVAVFIVSLPL